MTILPSILSLRNHDMHQLTILLLVLGAALSLPVQSNEAPDLDGARIEIPSTFNPVGSGARALGLGGAFIAMADDATAASWNPANLVRIRRPRFAVVGAYTHRREDNRFDSNPEASGIQPVDDNNLNYLALSLPCKAKYCGKNMVFSLNYQHLFDFNRDWSFDMAWQRGIRERYMQQHYRQEGQLYAIGLAWGVQLTRSFYAGLTVNLWQDFLFDNRWSQRYTILETGQVGTNPVRIEKQERYDYTFSGLNANLGLRWEAWRQGLGTGGERKLILGAVVKTPFDANTEQRTYFQASTFYPEAPAFNNEGTPITDRMDGELSMPLAFGFGLALQVNRHWTTALDITHTRWSDFVQTDDEGNKTSPLSQQPLDQTDIANTTQIRLGAEYRRAGQGSGIIQDWRLRGGAFYDPAPADEGRENFYGLSVGTGLLTQHVALDIAYQYRFGRDVGGSGLEHLGFAQDVDEHTVYVSMFVRR